MEERKIRSLRSVRIKVIKVIKVTKVIKEGKDVKDFSDLNDLSDIVLLFQKKTAPSRSFFSGVGLFFPFFVREIIFRRGGWGIRRRRGGRRIFLLLRDGRLRRLRRTSVSRCQEL